jgi:hypothetical protein
VTTKLVSNPPHNKLFSSTEAVLGKVMQTKRVLGTKLSNQKNVSQIRHGTEGQYLSKYGSNKTGIEIKI